MSNLKTYLVTFGAVLGLAGGGVLYAQAEGPSAGTMHGAHGQMMQEHSGDMMKKMMEMMGQMNQMMENCNKMMQSMASPQDRKQTTNTTPAKQD